MAGFTYDSRRRLTESMQQAFKEKAHLSEQERKMLPDGYYYNMPQDLCAEMRQLCGRARPGS